MATYRKCGTHAQVFSKHSGMATARMKYDKETKGNKRGVSMEISKTGIQEQRRTDGLSTVPSGSLRPDAVDELPN